MDDIRPRGRGNFQPRAPMFSRPNSFTPPPKPEDPKPEPPKAPEPDDDDDLFNFMNEEQARPQQMEQRRPEPARQAPSMSVRPSVSVKSSFSFQGSQKREDKVKDKKSKKKLLIILAIILLLLAALAGAFYWFKIKPSKNQPAITSAQPAEQANAKQPEKLSGTFKILATGDILTHDSVNNAAKKADGTYDYAPMLTEIKPILEKVPARICHQAVPASGGALSGYPSFNASAELEASLAGSGCNVLGLASDHINDKGQSAIDATLSAISAQKSIVITSGANKSAEDQQKPQFFNAGNGAFKVAYFSYTTKQNNGSSAPYGVNVYNKDAVKQQIQTVRSTADIVLVSMCWGKEDSGDIQGEQETISQELSDAGVDVVFGHCPHFVQPVKRYKSSDGSRETVVFHSLGNTLNSELPIEALIGGMASVDVDLQTKKITSVGFLPTYMHYEWTADQKSKNDVSARHNLKLYPLDKAAAPLAASQNGTTVEAQTSRLTGILNSQTTIKMLTSADF